LGVFALVRKGDAIRQFDVRATGERENGTPWVVAVHLSNDGAQKGQHGFGACGHAVLHCHVGPDMDAVPKVRVPLPALGPAEALDWVLSQLIPTPRFEPAPWAEIETMLKKATP
jgi:hypothetical protein